MQNLTKMISVETFIRVRYSETDQMGIVYYGNYAQYYEVGRVELLRELGMSYKAVEESGTIMPVAKMECKYIKPAKYDDKLRIVTKITSMPSARVTFESSIYNEAGELLNIGNVTLAFVDLKTNRPGLVPESIQKVFEPYFI